MKREHGELMIEGLRILQGEHQILFVVMLDTLMLPSRPYTNLFEIVEAMK
jgi:hypothetical protein